MNTSLNEIQSHHPIPLPSCCTPFQLEFGNHLNGDLHPTGKFSLEMVKEAPDSSRSTVCQTHHACHSKTLMSLETLRKRHAAMLQYPTPGIGGHPCLSLLNESASRPAPIQDGKALEEHFKLFLEDFPG